MSADASAPSPHRVDYVYIVDDDDMDAACERLAACAPGGEGGGAEAEARAHTHHPPRRPPTRYSVDLLTSVLGAAGVKPKLARKVRRCCVVLWRWIDSRLEIFFSHHSSPQLSKAALRRLAAAHPPTQLPPPIIPPSLVAVATVAPRSALRTAVADAAADAATHRVSKPLLLPAPDFDAAAALVEGAIPVVVLLAGAAGSGKSTLATLLAARLGGAIVASTDALRHMSAVAASMDPGRGRDAALLAASTYDAGGVLAAWERGGGGGGSDAASAPPPPLSTDATLRGYEAQVALLQPAVDRLLAACGGVGADGGGGSGSNTLSPAAATRAAAPPPRALVIEGVHVTPDYAAAVTASHPCAVPFVIHISNEGKHRDRFAVRARSMVTVAPGRNRYVAALGRVRAIQAYLLRGAGRTAIPTVDNTSVDRSVAAMAATVLQCVKRAARGAPLTERVAGHPLCRPVAAEYAAATASLWSSKTALTLIREKRARAAAAAAVNGDWGRPGVPPPPSAPSTSASSPPPPPSDLDAADFLVVSPSRAAARRGGDSDDDDDDTYRPAFPDLPPPSPGVAARAAVARAVLAVAAAADLEGGSVSSERGSSDSERGEERR